MWAFFRNFNFCWAFFFVISIFAGRFFVIRPIFFSLSAGCDWGRNLFQSSGSIYFSQCSNILSPHDSNDGIDEPKSGSTSEFQSQFGHRQNRASIVSASEETFDEPSSWFPPIKVSSFHIQLRFCYHTWFFNRHTSHLKIKSYS